MWLKGLILQSGMIFFPQNTVTLALISQKVNPCCFALGIWGVMKKKKALLSPNHTPHRSTDFKFPSGLLNILPTHTHTHGGVSVQVFPGNVSPSSVRRETHLKNLIKHFFLGHTCLLWLTVMSIVFHTEKKVLGNSASVTVIVHTRRLSGF